MYPIHRCTLVTVTSPYRFIMIVYTVETIGGQITSYEANKENLPKFLEKPVKESFKKYGFCMWKTPEYECIIYPTLQAAQHAIQWTIENYNYGNNEFLHRKWLGWYEL